MLVKGPSLGLGIDTNISVIVVSLTTKYWYQFLFYYGENKSIINKQIMCR